MTRRFLWGLLAVAMAFGTAGCGAKETPAPTAVSGQAAGAETVEGEEKTEEEAVAETPAPKSAENDGKTYTIRIAIVSSDSHLHNTVLNQWAQEAKEKTMTLLSFLTSPLSSSRLSLGISAAPSGS